MNILPFETRVRIVSSLVDGASLRATSRMTGAHRDSIGRFAVAAGEACGHLHDQLVRDVQSSFIEADEIWCFVQKKQGHRRQDDPPEYGDQYVYVAMDATTKLLISYGVGKRNRLTTHRFIADLRARVLGRPQISTDAFHMYPDAIETYFGPDVDFATVEKSYTTPHAPDAARRYSPGRIRSMTKTVLQGSPEYGKISTSYVERQNLTMRMQMRRFTRLTSGFSKKLRNLEAAVSLYVAWFNFCRVHETLRVTPAMETGLTDHVWSIAELLDAALSLAPTTPPAVAPIADGPKGVSAGIAKGERRGQSHVFRKGRAQLRLVLGGLNRDEVA